MNEPPSQPPPTAGQLRRERWRLLLGLERWLERPMIVLGGVWLALLVLEFTRGETHMTARLGMAIWAAFVFDFLLKLTIAPRKLTFLKRRWFTALSLFVPALRLLRAFRVLRLARVLSGTRGLRLIRLLSALNRGMRSLGATMSRRGLGYVVALTALVLLAGAAGMYALEHEVPHEAAPRTFGAALWWTAMVLTTMGSEYWPRTAEGRALCLGLALYSFAVFGYLAAALASHFVGKDTGAADAQRETELRRLADQISALREELRKPQARS